MTISQTILPAIGENYRRRDNGSIWKLIWGNQRDYFTVENKQGKRFSIPPEDFWDQFIYAKARTT